MPSVLQPTATYAQTQEQPASLVNRDMEELQKFGLRNDACIECQITDCTELPFGTTQECFPIKSYE